MAEGLLWLPPCSSAWVDPVWGLQQQRRGSRWHLHVSPSHVHMVCVANSPCFSWFIASWPLIPNHFFVYTIMFIWYNNFMYDHICIHYVEIHHLTSASWFLPHRKMVEAFETLATAPKRKARPGLRRIRGGFRMCFDVFWAPKPWESHLCFDGKPILGPSGFSQLE